MNKVENVTRQKVSTPETELPLVPKGPQNQLALMKLQLNQALIQTFNSTSTSSSNNIGSTSSALSAGGTTYLPNVSNMPFYVQKGNSCGTTTLAEIMSYLGVPMTQADVDNGIRRM